jgi:hypothetical protein
MADENTEQLKIQATLDTSNLQGEAKKAFGAVGNEAKKLEGQVRQTSKALDNVGDSATKAAQKGTQALKQMGNEADRTAKKVSSIDSAVKNIKLGQALGLAQRFASSDMGKGIGNSIGDALGMDDSAKGLAGGAIQGGLAGAAMGMQIAGPMGAAVGSLVGAGAGLLNAAKVQERAAVALLKSAEERQKANAQRTKDLDNAEWNEQEKAQFDSQFKKLVEAGDFTGAQKLIDDAKKEALANFQLGDRGIRNKSIQMDAVPLDKRGAKYKSYDDYLNMRQNARSELADISRYELALKKAQESKPETIKQEVWNMAWKPKAGNDHSLTDSLTRIGGSSGYGYVNIQTKMSNGIQSMDKTMKEILTVIKGDSVEGTEATF